jgi:hypothetical protein
MRRETQQAGGKAGVAPTATSGWPADQYWNWAFAMPDRKMGERIGLRLRQKSKQLAPGTKTV